MQKVEKHIVVGNSNLETLCHLSKNLYNYANYLIRQEFITNKKLLNEYELTGQLAKEKQIDYYALPPQTSQQIIKLLFRNWKSFFKTNKEYKNNPNKFLGRPKLPKYKDKNGMNIVVFTNQQCKLKDGFVVFPKKANINPIKTKVDNVQQVRIIPQATCFVVEIVYKKENVQLSNLKEENVLSIDLGVSNLAACVNNVGNQPFIINGKILKSINQFYNKEKARLQSFIGGKGTSNRIERLTFKRNNKVNDYLHKTSAFIINYCVKYDIGTIIIGHNKEWKNESKMGKQNNQNFVQIPFNKLIQQLQYKGEELGIKVIITEESYTSKVDHFAFEEMKHQEIYLGKRIKRGLFQSSTGCLLNADVNGAIGIGRKVIGDSFVREIINRGFVLNPIKVNNFNKVRSIINF